MAVENLIEVFATLSTKPNLISDVEATVEQCVSNFDLRQAKTLAQQLDQAVSSAPRSVQTQVRGLAARLKILAWPLYSNYEDILSPLKVGLGGALQYDEPNIIQRIRAKLIDFVISERDQWRQDMIAALHQNADVITASGPRSENQNPPGTIGAWLANYDQLHGIDLIDNIKIADYIFRSKWTRGASASERALLSRLFNIYEYLKLSSETALGIEEEIDFIDGSLVKDFNNGRPVAILDLTRGLRTTRGHIPVGIGVQRANVGESILTAPKPAPSITVERAAIVTPPAPPVTIAASTAPKPVRAFVGTVTPPTTPVVLKTADSAFFIDLADEREADKHRMSNDQFLISKTLEQQLRAAADEVIKQNNFSFKDESSRRRFVALFVSYLKDVRSVVDMREAMLKSVEAGGLGLASDKTEQVLKIIDEVKQQRSKVSITPKVASPSPLPIAPAEAKKPVSAIDKLIEADIGAFLIKPASNASQAVVPKLEVSAPRVVIENATIVVPPQPAAGQAAPVASSTPKAPKPALPPIGFSPDKVQEWRQEMLKEIARVAPPVPTPGLHTSPTPPHVVPLPNQGRPQLSDIKAPPRTLGPVGELKSLGVVDFRRLGPVMLALEKVQAKIDLIGEASIGKRLEAVRAWQASPVYQQYLRLGRESIEQGKSVAELTAELSAAGDEVLTEAEFNAIVDFNVKLRF